MECTFNNELCFTVGIYRLLNGAFADRNDVWNSVDGVKWRRVVEKCPWKPRGGAAVVVFDNRIWLIGGGVTDGPIFNDAWSSGDGVKWERATSRLAARPVFGYSAIVYDGQIWLVGANRDGVFKNAMLVSSDGVNWTEQSAPGRPGAELPPVSTTVSSL